MANISGIMQLYTAYFNRAADKVGVDYWAGMMDSNEWSLDDVAQSFSDQVEYQNQYNGLTQTQIVEQVYQNVLNRAGEAGGINYWSGELSSGNISVSQLVNAIVNASVEKDGNGNYKNSTDATIFNNKIQVSQYCYDNNVNATENNAISLSSITTDFSSVSSIQSIASGFIEETVDNSNNFSSGGNLNLSNLNDYSYVFLYENVSAEFATSIVGDDYYSTLYADASTWNGIKSLGFISNYVDGYSYEVSYSDDFSTFAVGIDFNQIDGTYLSLLAQYGIDLSEYGADINQISQYSGNYDLILAI